MDLSLLRQQSLLNYSLENAAMIQNSPHLNQYRDYIRHVMSNAALPSSTLSTLQSVRDLNLSVSNFKLTAGHLSVGGLTGAGETHGHFHGQSNLVSPSILKGCQLQKIHQSEPEEKKVRPFTVRTSPRIFEKLKFSFRHQKWDHSESKTSLIMIFLLLSML